MFDLALPWWSSWYADSQELARHRGRTARTPLGLPKKFPCRSQPLQEVLFTEILQGCPNVRRNPQLTPAGVTPANRMRTSVPNLGLQNSR